MANQNANPLRKFLPQHVLENHIYDKLSKAEKAVLRTAYKDPHLLAQGTVQIHDAIANQAMRLLQSGCRMTFDVEMIHHIDDHHPWIVTVSVTLRQTKHKLEVSAGLVSVRHTRPLDKRSFQLARMATSKSDIPADPMVRSMFEIDAAFNIYRLIDFMYGAGYHAVRHTAFDMSPINISDDPNFSNCFFSGSRARFIPDDVYVNLRIVKNGANVLQPLTQAVDLNAEPHVYWAGIVRYIQEAEQKLQ